MSGDVEEQVSVLGSRVLGAVGAGVAHDQHDGLVGVGLFGLTKKGNGRVGDPVWKVVLGIVKAMFHLQKKK